MAEDPKNAVSRRHADPELATRPSKDRFRPFGAPRWLGFLLFGLFWFLLLIPKLRRLRRCGHWPMVRKGLVLAWAAVGAAGLWYNLPWLAAVAALGALATSLLGQTRDPGFERKLQAELGADYCLNGGRLAEMPETWQAKSRVGEAFFVFLKGGELLFVPRIGEDNQRVRHWLKVGELEAVLVDGEPYKPVYVSEAKDPPKLDTTVDKKAFSVLELELRGGERAVLAYRGGFAKHLAGTAAHAIYSTWALECPDRVPGEAPKVLHVIGG